MSRSRDGLLLAIGTLTRLPVPPPNHVDRQVAGVGMSIAPLIGLLLSVFIAVPVEVAAWILNARSHPLPSTLIAILAIAGTAWLTRGLHLDGLADLADALGSNRPAEQALVIARQSDIGPFGTMTIALALAIQAAALAVAVDSGYGAITLATALITSRLALSWACTSRWPPARPDGLGATVAQSTRESVVLVSTAVLIALTATAGWLLLDNILGALALPAGVTCGLLGAVMTLRLARRRLGGITGDVLGACVEVAFAAALVAMAFLLSVPQAH